MIVSHRQIAKSLIYKIISFVIVDCGITNCIVCNVMDRVCTRCKEGYRLSSENECNGEHMYVQAMIV